jgi:hypothetical protein
MVPTVMEQKMIYINVDQTDGECLIVDTLKMSPLYVVCNGMILKLVLGICISVIDKSLFCILQFQKLHRCNFLLWYNVFN